MSGELGWLGVVACLLLRAGYASEPGRLVAIAVSPDGKTYVADRQLPGILEHAEAKFMPFFTGKKQFRTPLNAVRCLAVDRAGKLLAGDSATREIYRFDDAGQPTPLTRGGIGIPISIAVTEGGDLLVADLELHRIWKLPEGGGKPELFVEVAAPRALCVDGEKRVWVVSHRQDQVIRFNADGDKREVVVAGRPFEFPSAIVVDAQGTAHVCDTYAKAIWRIPPGQKPEKRSPVPALKSPVGIAFQGRDLLIVDPQIPDIVRMSFSQ